MNGTGDNESLCGYILFQIVDVNHNRLFLLYAKRLFLQWGNAHKSERDEEKREGRGREKEDSFILC